jgi:cytochrome c
MWNHAPQMWERIKVEHLSIPKVKEKEMADLFAFLYAIRYFDEPGNPGRGKELLEEKGCIQCHSLKGEGGKIAPDLARWGSFANPILWAQVMWNKAPLMEDAIKDKGLPWPEFEGSEMVDLLSYIRHISASSYEQQIFLLPADPNVGKALFESKFCIKCHAVRGVGGTRASDFGRRVSLPRTLTQLAGRMWSHSPNMWEEMKKDGIARPEFSGREMADLIVYLYAVQYVDQPGDAKNGEKLFTDKHCAFCHSKIETNPSKIDLGKWKGKVTPVFLAFALWTHGPAMYERMQELNIEWPTFEGNEVSNILEYLNQ